MNRLCLATVLLVSARVGAAPSRPAVAVVPVGADRALAPTAAVAQAFVEALNAKQPGRARLAYPRPEVPPRPIDESTADELMASAMRSFENLEFGAVRKDAKGALAIYKQGIKSGGAVDGFLHALHLLAAAALFDGDSQAAFLSMNDALIFRATPPSSKKFNPTVQKLYADVSAKPTEEHQGSVRISARDAVVWFNRKLRGVAAGVHTMRAGLYLVEVYRPGAALWARWFRVEPGQTRELAVPLKATPAAREMRLVSALRDESERGAPGSAVLRASELFGADEVVLVGSHGSCKAGACGVRMAWARAGRWAHAAKIELRGDPGRAASELLTATAAVRHTAGGPCTLDSHCGIAERCIGGRCGRPRSIFRKWWFWAAVGAVIAGTTVAIAVPLSRPDAPVIEVR